jgi:hypothetical protein
MSCAADGEFREGIRCENLRILRPASDPGGLGTQDAAQPTNRDDFDERRRHRSHGTSCSFPITVTFQAKHVGTAFFDAQGNFQRATVETNAVGTNSANGITLRETDHVVDFYNSTGYVKETGLPIHVQDGGVVIRDAGYLLFNPDGTVALIHGPHPQLEGDTAAVCAALS